MYPIRYAPSDGFAWQNPETDWLREGAFNRDSHELKLMRCTTLLSIAIVWMLALPGQTQQTTTSLNPSAEVRFPRFPQPTAVFSEHALQAHGRRLSSPESKQAVFTACTPDAAAMGAPVGR